MGTTDVQAIKRAHKVLAEFTYELGTIERGYTGRTLYVNLSDKAIASTVAESSPLRSAARDLPGPLLCDLHSKLGRQQL